MVLNECGYLPLHYYLNRKVFQCFTRAQWRHTTDLRSDDCYRK
jgi:hypothetical protein